MIFGPREFLAVIPRSQYLGLGRLEKRNLPNDLWEESRRVSELRLGPESGYLEKEQGKEGCSSLP